MTLTWPTAQDNAAVTGYAVQVDDNEPQQLAAERASLLISNLHGGHIDLLFGRKMRRDRRVQLSKWVFTPDTEVPVWPAGATLIPSQLNPRRLQSIGPWH